MQVQKYSFRMRIVCVCILLQNPRIRPIEDNYFNVQRLFKPSDVIKRYLVLISIAS